MATPKYDWHSLKAEYFKSDIIDVKGFFESIWHSHNTHIIKNTKGWNLEKKKWKKELKQKVIEEAEKEFIKTYKPDIEELGKYHKALMWIIAKKLNSMAKKETDAEDIFVSDVERLWKMVKTEKNEPTSISDNTNRQDWPIDFGGVIEVKLPE